MPKIHAQRWLTGIWSVFALLSTAVLMYGVTRFSPADSNDIWQWYSPYVFPTLLLMVGTLVAAETREETGTSSRAFFVLCSAVLVFYGICLLYTVQASIQGYVASAGSIESSVTKPLDYLKTAGGWLTGIQSVVNAALGGFFIMSSPKKEPAPAIKS